MKGFSAYLLLLIIGFALVVYAFYISSVNNAYRKNNLYLNDSSNKEDRARNKIDPSLEVIRRIAPSAEETQKAIDSKYNFENGIVTALEDKYSFKPPDGWEIKYEDNMVIIYDGVPGPFTPHIRVLRKEIPEILPGCCGDNEPGSSTVADFNEWMERPIGSGGTGIYKYGINNIDGIDAVIYANKTPEGYQGDPSFTITTWLQKDNHNYRILLTTGKYEDPLNTKYGKIYDELLESFEFSD